MKRKGIYALLLAGMLGVTGCGSTDVVNTGATPEQNYETEHAETEETEVSAYDEAGEASTEQEETEDTVTVVMVGDVLLHTPVAESGKKEDGTYSFDHLFEHVKDDIAQADLALVNQEVIIGGEELGVSGYPCFNAPYELGDALYNAGFDVVLHATNHALDKGKSGIENCLSFWKEEYPTMNVVGINESQEAQDEICVIEKNGIRIAVLNYTYGTNGIELPADMPYAVNLLEEDKVTSDLQKAQEEADFTIVCPHWGTEYSLEETAEQEKWTEIFYENGADLVIGTHPHVIEPITWYEDEMLVYDSLGNFVNWTSGTGTGVANRMVGGMAEVTIQKNEDGEAEITDYGIEPLVSHVESGYEGVTVYKLSDYTEELAEKNEIRKQDEAFSLDYCKNLCEEVWGEEYKGSSN